MGRDPGREADLAPRRVGSQGTEEAEARAWKVRGVNMLGGLSRQGLREEPRVVRRSLCSEASLPPLEIRSWKKRLRHRDPS